MRFWLNSWDNIHGIVQFQSAKHARKFVFSRIHTVSIHTVEHGSLILKVLDPIDLMEPECARARCHFYIHGQFSNSDLPRMSEGTEMLDLNDDCIQEVFGCLNSLDFCSVAEVCQRFKEIAQKRFAIQHKSFNLFEVAILNVDRMKDFIKNFGPFIEKLEVSSVSLVLDRIDFSDKLVSFFPSLNALTLHRFDLNDAMVAKLRPLLVRLKKLCLVDCDIEDAFTQVLAHCTELKQLKIDETLLTEETLLTDYVWRPVRLPKLETFALTGMHQALGLQKFLDCNQHLKKVELDVQDRSKTVLNHEMIEVYTLIDMSGDMEISHLFRMSALKTLTLGLAYRSSSQAALIFHKMAAAKVPLERLKLTLLPDGLIDQVVAAICKVKTLKTLCFYCFGLSTAHLFQFCENIDELIGLHAGAPRICNWDQDALLNILYKAKKVQRIRLEGIKVTITAECYEKLLQCARGRAATTPLEIIINNGSMKVVQRNVPRSTLNANRSILMVFSFVQDPPC